jgi:hypothetical protein
MTEQNNQAGKSECAAVPASLLSPTPPRLLTCDQVISALRAERDRDGLAATARRYDLAPQQVCDLLAGRTKLSRRMRQKLQYRLWEFFEKVGD